MLQHEDSDEDDFEGYFLQPVNGYNIKDKILLANQELFDSPAEEITSPISNNTSRRVTFRQILVDYEPEYSSLDEYCEVNSDDVEQINIDDIIIDEIVEEEEEEENEEIVESNKIIESGYSSCEEVKEQIDEILLDITPLNIMSSDTINDDVDEICEEIEDLTIQEVDAEIICTTTNKVTTSLVDGYRESINLSELYECSSDSKECDSVVEVIPITETIKIIVEKKSDIEIKPKQKIQKQKCRVTSFSTSNSTSKDSFKTNSLKRPILVRKMNSIENKNLKLNLNFRSCCDNKYDGEVLPKYNGYYSQYGLTKEQLEKRETRLETFRRKQIERKTNTKQMNANKSDLNEEQFSKWLNNKMKNPKNKTINMFDYKMKKHKKK